MAIKAKNINHMLIVAFYVFAVNTRIASSRHVFKLPGTITFGRQWATAQPVPLVFRVVVAFHGRFLLLLHGHDIYLSPGGP